MTPSISPTYCVASLQSFDTSAACSGSLTLELDASALPSAFAETGSPGKQPRLVRKRPTDQALPEKTGIPTQSEMGSTKKETKDEMKRNGRATAKAIGIARSRGLGVEPEEAAAPLVVEVSKCMCNLSLDKMSAIHLTLWHKYKSPMLRTT